VLSDLLWMVETLVLELNPTLAFRYCRFQLYQADSAFETDLFAMSHFDTNVIRDVFHG
jgi:hypothetical protein